jgi:prepilin-type N-terminal cleavage/methylation domain-containing protein
MKKNAFTMIELIFVIVIMGILSAVLMPNNSNDPLKEAAAQIKADIKYTQHLAMTDDRYNTADTNWYKERWQILFSSNAGSNNKIAYTIFSDNVGVNSGNPNESEVAIAPGNPSRRMTGGYNTSNTLDYNHVSFVGLKRMNLGEQYGIVDVVFSSSCSINGSKRLAFDYLGRPVRGNLRFDTDPYMNGDLLANNCLITLTDGDGNQIVLTVEAETGYVRVTTFN